MARTGTTCARRTIRRAFSTPSPTGERPAPRPGCSLAIENVSWCALASVRDVLAFAAQLEEIDPEAERIGFAFDPFQAAEAGANPFMVLAAMEDRVFDVHLSDRREDDPEHRHLPPGEGDLPWPALLRAISGAYSGPLMLEGVVGDDLDRLEASRRCSIRCCARSWRAERDALCRRAAARGRWRGSGSSTSGSSTPATR